MNLFTLGSEFKRHPPQVFQRNIDFKTHNTEIPRLTSSLALLISPAASAVTSTAAVTTDNRRMDTFISLARDVEGWGSMGVWF